MLCVVGHPMAMHVARIRSSHVDRSGQRRDYESVLLRRTFREAGKVKHETLANLSGLGAETVTAIEAALGGVRLVPADGAVTITRSLPHGHVAAVAAMAASLGLPDLLGPSGRARDLALGLIISRVVRPASKSATLGWWADTTLGVDLGIAGACTDEVYAAMDWLTARQDAIEAALAARHLSVAANPSRMALFDLSSSWVEGSHCELAARGYSRDGKKGKAQIEYGLLTDPVGRPVAVRCFTGNTADPTAFITAVEVVRTKFGLTDMVMVGDRGMITSARIAALRELGGLSWLTCLRAPAIAALAAPGGPLQLTLFDQADLAEITHPDYPGERLIACRNPFLAAERARKRSELLVATETAIALIATRVVAGKLAGADRIGIAVGKVINRHKMAKHFDLAITDTTLSLTRRPDAITAEAALDGIYALRTPVDAATLPTAAVVAAYKSLAHVERNFRTIKADDLDLRPIWHRLQDRVRAHVLICMLAAYLVWHLRRAWAELTYTDEHPATEHDNPVAPAARSTHAEAKASRHHHPDTGAPIAGFRALLTHLGTLTRNDLRFTGTHTTIPTLAEATPRQARAFALISAPIPLTITP